MRNKMLKIGAMMLAAGLSCSFLLAGCAEVGGNNGMKNELQPGSGSENPNVSVSGSPQTEGDDTVSTPTPPEWYIRTDAQMYYGGSYNADESWLTTGREDSQQTVYITASGGSDAWVGVYKAEDTGFQKAEKTYKLADTNGFRYALPANSLSAGDYVAALFQTEDAATPRATAAFTVTRGAVLTNKTQYFQNEQIVFSFYADTTNTSQNGGSYRWLGLYKKQDGGSYGGDYLKWVTLCGNQLISGQGYILQENKVGSVGWSSVYPARAANAEAVWEPGSYELVLFGDGGYSNVLAKAEFTVTAGRTGKAYAPESVYMNAYGAEKGVLSGEVLCSFAPDRFNVSEVVAYWADEDGVLEGYLPFGAQRVTGNPQRYYAFENIMIPEGATNLRFYGKNADGLGDSYFRVDLPENAKAFGSGETVLSEFAYLSDIHVGYTDYRLVDGETVGTEVVRNSNNYAAALNDIKSVLGANSDVFIVGDVTESGREEEWTLVDEITAKQGFADSVYYMLGNHDYYAVYDRGDWQTGTDFATAVSPFTGWVTDKAAASGGAMTVGGGGLWYDVKVNGVHHISLNTEGADGDWVCAHLSAAQLAWLEERLEAVNGEPVFVYLHQPLTDTTSGTLPGEGWDHVKIMEENGWLVRSADRLKRILGKYPNAFFVSGHNHRELDSYRAVFPASTAQKNNFIQTGGTAYIDKEITPGVNLRHEGWYVRVYADKVVFLGREFTTGMWLSGACYVYDLK